MYGFTALTEVTNIKVPFLFGTKDEKIKVDT